jgi:DNA-binding IclR family transcriptional regulator
VCGAVTIAGPIQRFTKDRRRKMRDSMLEAADSLSQMMGKGT